MAPLNNQHVSKPAVARQACQERTEGEVRARKSAPQERLPMLGNLSEQIEEYRNSEKYDTTVTTAVWVGKVLIQALMVAYLALNRAQEFVTATADRINKWLLRVFMRAAVGVALFCAALFIAVAMNGGPSEQLRESADKHLAAAKAEVKA